MNDIVTRDANGRFMDGHAGMGGRPIGSRQTFSAAFLRDLGQVWADHGKASMLHTARANPETFFATCARLLPRDVELTIRQNYSGGLDETDLQILRAIRDGIPGANEMEPQAVLEFVLAAVRSHGAKLITHDRETRDKNSQITDKS